MVTRPECPFLIAAPQTVEARIGTGRDGRPVPGLARMRRHGPEARACIRPFVAPRDEIYWRCCQLALALLSNDATVCSLICAYYSSLLWKSCPVLKCKKIKKIKIL
jgi:hypothetical protein